jgi:hypothetical protein
MSSVSGDYGHIHGCEHIHFACSHSVEDHFFRNPLCDNLKLLQKIAIVAFHVFTFGVPLAIYHIVNWSRQKNSSPHTTETKPSGTDKPDHTKSDLQNTATQSVMNDQLFSRTTDDLLQSSMTNLNAAMEKENINTFSSCKIDMNLERGDGSTSKLEDEPLENNDIGYSRTDDLKKLQPTLRIAIDQMKAEYQSAGAIIKIRLSIFITTSERKYEFDFRFTRTGNGFVMTNSGFFVGLPGISSKALKGTVVIDI